MNVEFVSRLVENFRNAIMSRANRKDERCFREAENDQSEVMTEEQKLDATIDDSFPASDPPGYLLKSEEDLKQY